MASAVILPLIIVVGSEKTWAIVSVWMIAFLCVLYGIYIFYLHFDEPRVRLFAISVPFLISAMLLLVPVIQYSGIDNRRKEVLWFESEAVQSSLISKSKVTLKNINRYSYVVLANSYSDMYTFDFEPANKKLTIYKKAEQGADK